MYVRSMIIFEYAKYKNSGQVAFETIINWSFLAYDAKLFTFNLTIRLGIVSWEWKFFLSYNLQSSTLYSTLLSLIGPRFIAYILCSLQI